MAVSKRLTLGFILASASLTIMAGSIIAPVLNLMRDALGVAPASVGLIITTGIFAGINVLILNMYGGIERDRVMGWRGSAQSFGGVIWPLIGGTLGAFSWRFPFAVYMLAIPIGLLAIATVPEPATQRRAGPESRVSASVFGVFRKSPVLLVIYGLMFFGNILLYAIVIFLPQLLESFGISSTFRIGLFITAMTASAGVTAFIYGKIRSRFSYRVIVA
ncbi:MAG: MFS transporter, partial [Deltaproteobacteria bacterium]